MSERTCEAWHVVDGQLVRLGEPLASEAEEFSRALDALRRHRALHYAFTRRSEHAGEES
jgi:hypothetical protein